MIKTNSKKEVLKEIITAFKGIGYRASWFKQDYAFADLYERSNVNRSVDLGIFGQEPFDYRSACFGLQFERAGETAQQVLDRIRALGAPQLLYVRDDKVERWQVKQAGAELLEVTAVTDLFQIIIDKQNEWAPQSVLRAKADFARPQPRNLDLVDIGLLPALEHEAAKKIDELVQIACAIGDQYHVAKKIELDAQGLFSFIFQLLVGKLLLDRGIPASPAIDFSDVSSVLSAVRNHYPSHDHNALKHLKLPNSVAKEIGAEIGRSFSFANLSAETLTYVYENTFVSAKSRKTMGIHSTPSYVADYILSQMPIEDIPQGSLNVFDPTCGHGIFLIAAMRRIRALLPSDWSPRQRHRFFVKRMHGVDMEPFSLEVARLCLMLADFPEANGWDLTRHDIFEGEILEEKTATASILVGNPPFEKLPGSSPLRRKPAELLKRALPQLIPGGLFGMVLPRAFLDGNDYKSERRQLLEGFDLLSITGLSDKVFVHSDAETAIIIARKGQSTENQFYFRQVLDQGLSEFKHVQKVSWEDKVPAQYLTKQADDSLIVPRLREVWEKLKSLPKLSDVASIWTGIRYTKKEPGSPPTHFSRPAPNRRLGILTVDSETFRPYSCEGQSYFSLDPDLQENGAYLYDWDADKVIVPASRNSRGPWRYSAALDNQGLCVSRRFYAVWPNENEDVKLPIEVIAALMNSPVAVGYTYTHSFQQDIRVETYESIPIPPAASLKKSAEKITSLVARYRASLKNLTVKVETLHRQLLAIDAEILKLYDLPPRLERQLLDMFWGHARNVPFHFEGYFPPSFKPTIPLHVYISAEFANARSDKVIERIPQAQSSETLDFLRALEDDDL